MWACVGSELRCNWVRRRSSFAHEQDEQENMIHFRNIGALVSALAAQQLLATVPPIDADTISGFFRIRTVNVTMVETPALPARDAGETSMALGRTSEWLTQAQLGPLGPMHGNCGSDEISIRRGDYFDLWNAFDSGGAIDGRHALRLSFEMIGASGDAVYLLLGANDSCAVFVDGRAVWGIVGQREHIEAENVVRIPVANGAAKVDVLCWKVKGWDMVPADHHEVEWSLNLGLCASEDEAWRIFTSKGSHFLDSPIAQKVGDLNTTLWLEQHSSVEFYDLDGVSVGSGIVLPTGRIALSRPIEAFDQGFVGIAVLGGNCAEAIILTGGKELDELMEPCLAAGRRTVPSWSAWDYRCRHLFMPEFLTQRNRWWARKAALSMAMAGLRTELDKAAIPFRDWSAAGMEFGDYTSQIDGTQQYYRAFVGPGKGDAPRPLVVVLPGVPMPVRPFLDSSTAADLQGAEMLMRPAKGFGCDLLWPGVVDIDYGGNFARVWIREALDAFARKHPTTMRRPIYLVGTCAAGAAAIGYAETFGEIDGLVLWSPVVDRPLYRWPFKGTDQWPVLTGSVMQPESSGNNLRALRRIPVFVLFDHDEPGHGDRPGTVALCRELTLIGGTVEEEWVDKPDHRSMWGMRAVASQSRWMQWISEQARNPVRLADQRSKGSLNRDTVKNTLLRGFVLAPGSDPIAQAWGARWTEMLRVYRGAEPDATKMPATATRVEVRALSGVEFKDELKTGFGSARPQLPDSEQRAADTERYNALFGIRLTAGSPDRVEVWCDSRGGADKLPPVDLFREGCCQAALWGLRDGRWELIQVWL